VHISYDGRAVKYFEISFFFPPSFTPRRSWEITSELLSCTIAVVGKLTQAFFSNTLQQALNALHRLPDSATKPTLPSGQLIYYNW